MGAGHVASAPPPLAPIGAKALTGIDRSAPLLVLAAVALWRFAQVQDLVLPAWVDSVHHTLVIRLLLEQRWIPDSWAPYLPAVPFYYHFGCHLSAALLAAATGLTGLDLGRAVLITGQLWQVAVAWAAYGLADALFQDRRRALAAMALVGFVSPMPAHYTSWGRYTLLAGLALLLFAMAAALRGRLWLVAVLVAAAAVTHYYAFCLLLLFLSFHVAFGGGLRAAFRLALAAALGLGIASPWLFHVWFSTLALARPAQAGGAGGGAGANLPIGRLLGPEHNYLLLSLAVLGFLHLARGCWRREPAARRATSFLLFGLALAVLLGPWQVGPFRPDHAAIVLFIPVTVLAADGLFVLVPPRGAVACLALMTAWGLAEGPRLVRRPTRLAQAADLHAIRWVDAHTSPRAVVLLDAMPWMGLWRGADGGWWITPLTGRSTVPPPVAYSWGPPELASVVRATARRAGDLVRLPYPEVCAAAERLMEETGAQVYYTWSHRVRLCGNLQALYEDGDGPALLARRGTIADPPRVPAGKGGR